MAMTSTTYETILVDEEDGVVTVTFNRPDKMNSYTGRMGLETRHAIWEADSRDDVRAIVVTGAGKAFCAGADLSSGGATFSGDGGGGHGGGRRGDGALGLGHPPNPDLGGEPPTHPRPQRRAR